MVRPVAQNSRDHRVVPLSELKHSTWSRLWSVVLAAVRKMRLPIIIGLESPLPGKLFFQAMFFSVEMEVGSFDELAIPR